MINRILDLDEVFPHIRFDGLRLTINRFEFELQPKDGGLVAIPTNGCESEYINEMANDWAKEFGDFMFSVDSESK